MEDLGDRSGFAQTHEEEPCQNLRDTERELSARERMLQSCLPDFQTQLTHNERLTERSFPNTLLQVSRTCIT
ncbi:hypothetical protein CgunFtcFv8_004780 [Champsocephalus gunnari]|uniref:Uncharacterized protein n=1 Tax=Champsocephalus gunnari TaxID=52237 RepID=A0AAN8HZ58_CHAGU|nr:hypothetical protein CgunFtcFv8_004780 [Champsocephalus gunnari]